MLFVQKSGAKVVKIFHPGKISCDFFGKNFGMSFSGSTNRAKTRKQKMLNRRVAG